MVQILDVKPELVSAASNHAKERLGFEYDRFNLDNNQRLSMIQIGTVGQMLFRGFLDENNASYEFQLQAGKYDDFDFVIGNRIIEIKTSGFKDPSGWKSLNGIYNASQLRSAKQKQYYCSVQIFVNGYDKATKMFDASRCTLGVIAGWLEIEQISKYPETHLQFGPAHLIPLSDLKDALDLINNL
jgi:hypothetical protein